VVYDRSGQLRSTGQCIISRVAAAASGLMSALQPDGAGVYVNFLDSDDDTIRVRAAYGDDTYWRLADVKAKYDPDNVFHNNKNIQPRSSGS
jgi:hypothetical protein